MELMKNLVKISLFLFCFVQYGYAQNTNFDTLYFECPAKHLNIKYNDNAKAWSYKAKNGHKRHAFISEYIVDTIHISELDKIDIKTVDWVTHFPKYGAFSMDSLQKYNKVLSVGSGRIGKAYDTLILVKKEENNEDVLLIKVNYIYHIDN